MGSNELKETLLPYIYGEDYIPKLKSILSILTEMDENSVDAQEMDYIDEINMYTEYMIEKYEGSDVKRPKLLFGDDL